MKENTGRIWTFNFTVLFLANCIQFMAQFMSTTVLPVYLDAIGLNAAIIGSVVAMFSITALASRIFTGPMIDSLNKKYLYIVMMALLTVSFLGYAIAGDNVGLIRMFRMLHGVSQGILTALSLVMVADELPPEKSASGISVYGLSSVLPSAIGPGLGLYIANNYSYKYAFLLCGILTILSIVMATRMKIKRAPGAKFTLNPSSIISPPTIVPALMVCMIAIARGGITTYLVLFTQDAGIAGITWYYIVNAVIMVFTRPLFGKISDKLGLRLCLIPTYVCFALNLILLASCKSTAVLLLCAALNAIGHGCSISGHQVISMSTVSPERRGAASSTHFIGIDSGDLVGSALMGVLVTAFGYRNMYLICLIPLVICVVGTYLWFFRHKDALRVNAK